ncbi:hypothetical protein [Paenibacillus sp. sgz500958]|uniref:hypothetical protein n=1 Tax=Paenibacillus sp. sgz500958 TaxID=3242475 RepID=UPI0036D3366D
MRLVKRALGVLLIAVLASSLSVLTTGIVVNAYIQSLLSSFDIKLDTPVSGLSGILKSVTGMNDNNSTDPDSSKTGDSPATEEDSAAGSTEKSTTEETGNNPAPQDALPVMGQEATETAGGDSALKQELVMTPEEMSTLKENIPSGEKVDIFNILMNKLPQAEMQNISTAMEDGLTQQEVEVIQQVISKYVDKDEYEILMKMLTPDMTEGQ